MKQNIKVAVIGGTGKSGKYLVRELIRQGFHIKLLLRNPDNFSIKSSLIETVAGNAADYDSVYSLLTDCQAVISTLGLGIPASEPILFCKSSSNVIQAMISLGLSRYIVTTGLNVDTSSDKKSPKVIFATDWMKKNYPVSTENKQAEYELLKASAIDWTLVRLPLIEQTDERFDTNVSLEDCLGDKISATDLADFLIEQLYDKTFIGKSLFLSNV
ncbi:NAD(P)-dependent oxidoreductase [Flavobacterium sp. HJJ]|uniref:NAD(P)-dependent oxidoreductase n=1 Tax=Flavobacterium sp. HJJ TaxID=2783792 RepID=UPI00188B0AFD|nr:NAD(P)H-binding protein [Flavobacterium sp. HJJ]MBF4471595.1 NAD(P)H-binding protein [Flavobacterium sp. HJJ]